MQVKDLMTEQVIVIRHDATLKQAASRMLDYDVGSIVVVQEDVPVGLLTQSDVLEAGVVTDDPFDRVAVTDVMSHPVVTVDPTTTVREAVELMDEHGVKHLPVDTETDLHGMVTSSDVVRNHGELVDEVKAIERRADDHRGTDAHEALDDATRRP